MDIYAPPLNLGRNLLINGNFAINQRGYASGTVLGSSVYAHDRWRDYGGGNCGYSYTQNTPDTLVTIASGTLSQVVEAQNVAGGTYTLSWTGSAPGYVGFTPAGSSYTLLGPFTSPHVVSGVPAGTQITVAFQAGTLGLVQLEAGTTPTPFERRPVGLEMALCLRYFERVVVSGSGRLNLCVCANFNSSTSFGSISYAYKRANPTITLPAQTSLRLLGNGGATSSTSLSISDSSPQTALLQIGTASGSLTQGDTAFLQANDNTSAVLDISAEL